MSNLPEISTAMMKSADFDLSLEELAFITTSSTRWPETWAHATTTLYTSKLLERALEKHAAALNLATKASEAHAAKLARVTWVLTGVAVLLAFCTFVLAVSVVVGLLLG